MVQNRVVLVILDGYGISLDDKGNAISAASTPTMDYIQTFYPFASLKASGISVGLSWHEPGNSEVGHMTIGTGRITFQYLPRIINSIRDGSFYKNPAFLKAVDNVKRNDSYLHIMGLLGSGAVHSYIDHLYALVELARRNDLGEKVRLHIFTDGRDSLPQEASKLVANLIERLKAEHTGKIASLIGRFFAMDRDGNWDRTEKAYKLLTEAEGQKTTDPVKTIENSYKQGFNDENLNPVVVTDKNGKPEGVVRDGDSVIFFNYREDRARQLTKAFVLPDKVPFKPRVFKQLVFVGMTEYEEGLPILVAFPPPDLSNCLSEVLSRAGKRQLHMAETEKYAHVTYFFNGSKEKPFPGEDRDIIPSLDVSSFAKKPGMRAFEITNHLLKAIEDNLYDFIVCNYANPDMLAHTGDFGATVKGIEIVDESIKRVLQKVEDDEKLFLLITADHGNAELMVDPYTGEKLTEHTTNPVPFSVVNQKLKRKKQDIEIFQAKRTSIGLLSDIAPTILDILGLSVPAEMTGKSLLGQMGIKI